MRPPIKGAFFFRDLETLDRTILLLGCHTTGLQLLLLSYGKIRLDGDGFNVKWEDEHDITEEGASEWGIFFRNYDHYLLTLSRRKLSHTGVHIRGVEVLTPGTKSLHFHDTGLIRDLSTNEQGLTLKQK